ncbi:alpha/beta hydrolase [Photobacterium minamisatsumaniensis]|uniref:alpha/beta hydrolase n=1 Tax=Photobacterium minamisatsumaniensis TaxID=2910233 RepID=UPI003D0B3AAF
MRQVSPKLQSWLVEFNRQAALLLENGFTPTPASAREGLAYLTRELVTSIPSIAWVEDAFVQGALSNVPVRIYHPAPEQALPVLVFYHGGGHMAGSVSVYDPICRKLAKATQHIVVSVEYRLAPENPYPAGLNDAYIVAQTIWTTLDNSALNYLPRLSLAGDSAGGALVASVSAKAQCDDTVKIAKQVLIYPSLDYTLSSDSVEENSTGYLLQKNKITWYFDSYFQHNENRQLASPLYGNAFSLLPETLIFTAEFCPLRDEGLRYSDKLIAAGVDVKSVHFPDMIHAFLNLENLVKEECDAVYRTIAEFLYAHG